MDKILDLMKERKKLNKNELEYKGIKIFVRMKIREAKEKEAVERCVEIEC